MLDPNPVPSARHRYQPAARIADRHDFAGQAIDAESQRERQADPERVERAREQDGDADARDRDGRHLKARQAFAEEDHAEHHVDERVEIVAEARRKHMVGEDGEDVDQPVDGNQKRTGDQHPQRTPIFQRRQIVAHLPPEDQDDETDRQRPDDALREHFDGSHARHQLEEQRNEAPDGIGRKGIGQPTMVAPRGGR